MNIKLFSGTAGIALGGLLMVAPNFFGLSSKINAVLPTTSTVPSFELHVVSDSREMQALYTKFGGKACPGCKVQGFTATYKDGSHAVYIMQPTHVNDANTTTLGHEVLHVVLGKYHDEGRE